MQTVYPDYYPLFHCIAGACRHSCCIGWEIDVDAHTMQRYERTEGAIGEKLRACVSKREHRTSFCATGSAVLF